jgi:spore coat polysaccharide biosynthesis protein SpsF
MKIGVVLQARMGSTRLPGKTLRPLLGRPMLHYVIERLKRIELADLIVLAVPDTEDDRALKDVAVQAGVEFFVGSETDVLDRYHRAADYYSLDHIYRATGDNPFVEAEVQDELIRYHLAGGFEYSESFLSLPHGLGGEVFSREGLQRCWQLSEQAHQREGVNDYILENRAEFHAGKMTQNPYRSTATELVWTVDTLEQFEWTRMVYEALYTEGGNMRIEDVLDLVAERGEQLCQVS